MIEGQQPPTGSCTPAGAPAFFFDARGITASTAITLGAYLAQLQPGASGRKTSFDATVPQLGADPRGADDGTGCAVCSIPAR